ATGPLNPFRPPRVLALSKRFSEKFLKEIDELKPAVRTRLYRIVTAESGEPALQLEQARDEEFLSAPAGLVAAVATVASAEQPERLTSEEMEAFYGYERRRLGLEAMRRAKP
ncbi:MAG TPA: hypothetical protein VGR38_09755, partial [Candidatus Polarisedimenticolia bacterium]|nr:hypothetical protein [Candidatus Polarisedimenticolia bacterium]